VSYKKMMAIMFLHTRTF